MTNEEIEKQSKEYAIQNYGTEDVVQSNLLQAIAKDSFQDGAKWGMEHAIEWHDLIKDPTDLPEESKEYWCKFSNNIYHTAVYDVILKYWFSKCKPYIVIAWCELPQFKDKE